MNRLTLAAMLVAMPLGLYAAGPATTVAPDLQKLLQDLGGKPVSAKPASPTAARKEAPSAAVRLTLATATPVDQPKLDTRRVQTPTHAAIEAAARRYVAAIAASLPAAQRQFLDETAGRLASQPNSLADAGSLLSLADAESGAYLLARSVALDAGRVGNLRNFGVLLYMSGDFPGALALQRYAELLAPGELRLQLDRAWTVLYLGDFREAERLLQAVLQRAPGERAAYEAMGLLRQGQGRSLEARDWFAKARARGFSAIASEGASAGDLVEPAPGAAPPPPPQPPAPDGITRPASEDEGGRSRIGSSPEDWGESFEMPQVFSDALAFGAAAGDYATLDQTRLAQFQETADRRRRVLDAIGRRPRGEEATAEDGSAPDPQQLEMPRLFVRQITELARLQNQVEPQLRRYQNDWFRRLETAGLDAASKQAMLNEQLPQRILGCGKDDGCVRHVIQNDCVARRGNARVLHSGMLEAWREDVGAMQTLMRQHYAATHRLMHEITEPELSEWQNLERRHLYEQHLLRIPMGTWASLVAQAASGGNDCPLPPPNPPPDPPERDPGEKKGRCDPADKSGVNLGCAIELGDTESGLGLKLGIGLKLSCDKLQIGGELFGQLGIVKGGFNSSVSRGVGERGWLTPGAEYQINAAVGADGPSGSGVSHEGGLYLSTLNGRVSDIGVRSQTAITKGGLGGLHSHEWAEESKVSLMPGANFGRPVTGQLEHTHFYGKSLDVPL